MPCIRIATINDLDDICKLVKLGVQEMTESLYETDDKVIRINIEAALKAAPTFIVEHGDRAIGIASLGLGSTIWSSETYLTTNMVHVLQEHRSFAIINKLYAAIRRYADLQGILYIDTFCGTDKIDARARLARTQKLETTGISIMYRGK